MVAMPTARADSRLQVVRCDVDLPLAYKRLIDREARRLGVDWTEALLMLLEEAARGRAERRVRQRRATAPSVRDADVATTNRDINSARL